MLQITPTNYLRWGDRKREGACQLQKLDRVLKDLPYVHYF